MVTNNFLANFKFPPSWSLAVLKIDVIDIITADKTKGIAGKDINWISVNPISFKGWDKKGRNLPIKIEIGKITKRKYFGFLEAIRNDFRDL